MRKASESLAKLKNRKSSYRKLNDKTKKRLGFGVAVAVVVCATLVALGVTMYQVSTESIGLQHGLSTLRSVQAADFLHLKAIMFGSKVGGNTSQVVDLYVKTDSIDERSDTVWNGKVDMFASYTTEDSIRYNITLVNSRGYYIVENVTVVPESESTFIHDVQCIRQDSMPPLSSLASALFNAKLMPTDASYAGNVQDILDCSNGDILEAFWDDKDFVFCVAYDDVAAENRVTEVATNGMHITIDYVSEDTVPSDILYSFTQGVPDLPDVFDIENTITCPTLSFDGYTVDSSFTRSSRKLQSKWYEKELEHHSVTRGRRRLFSSFNFYVLTTTSEYDAFTSFAVDVLACTYFCGPAEFGHSQIPIGSIMNYIVTSDVTNYRKLSEVADDAVSASITLPRICYLVHGAGFLNENANDYLRYTSYRQYFGYVDTKRPCYCSAMYFTRLNTLTMEWYNTNLQLYTCRTIAKHTGDNAGVVNNKVDDVRTIRNAVLISHYTASLTLAAAFVNGYCILDASTKWATIHTPAGLSSATSDEDESPNAATLCSRDNIEKLIETYNTYQSSLPEYLRDFTQSDFFNGLVDAIFDETVAGGKTLLDVIEACSYLSAEDSASWLQHLRAVHFPDDVTSLFNKVQNFMGNHVSAALCGYAKYGLLSNKAFLNQLTAKLISTEDAVSDGATPLSDCLKLADFNSDISFSTDDKSPFVATNSHQLDITEFRDGWTGEDSNMRSWVDNLRMHRDLGGTEYYQGCFIDDKDSRVFNYVGYLTPNGREECRDHCMSHSPEHEYYGLEYGYECFCGSSSLTRNGGVRDDVECNMACTDGSGDMCGGRDRISIYAIGAGGDSSQTPPVKDPYVGCYKDYKTRRVLSYRKELRRNNGRDACKAACISTCGKHKYFGLKFGYECYCGSGSPTMNGGVRNDEECDMNCPDNSGDKCGGRDRISIYLME